MIYYMVMTKHGWVGKSNQEDPTTDTNRRSHGYTWDEIGPARSMTRHFPGGVIMRITLKGEERQTERLATDGTWQPVTS